MSTDTETTEESQQPTVLVTGGAGYIGSWVTRHLLEAGFHVVVFDNLMYGGKPLLSILGHPHLSFVKGDIRDLAALETAMKGVDHVAHLAAIVGEAACKKSPEVTKAINFTGTQNVARAAMHNGVQRFIFFSTCSSYGVQDTSQMANEQTQLNPVSLYAETKIDSEKFLLDTVNGDMFCTIFRPSTVHGPSARMRFDLIVNHFVRDAFTTHKLLIYGYKMWRPLMWVGEAGQAIKLALCADESLVRNEIFNLGATEANYRKSEIGEIIKNKYMPDLELSYGGTDQDVRSYRVDFSKIRERLGFTLSKSLDEAIGDILQLLEANIIDDSQSPEYQNH